MTATASLFAMAFHDIRAVLFDLDGTLVHTRIDFPDMKRRVLEIVEKYGRDPAPLAERDILTIIASSAPQLPAGFAEEAEQALVEIEVAACEGACLAEGAEEILAWLPRHGIRVGIVTRNSPAAVSRVLREFSLPHEVLLTRADTPRVKPDPLHLELALRELNTPPAQALMVGDHIMDVQGGKAAGMRTLGLLTPERPPDFFAPAAPDGVIRSLLELRQWISPSSS